MADEIGGGSGQPERDVPEVRAGEPEKLVEQSVVPRKKNSKFWYVALIVIVLAAGYYSYTNIFTPDSAALGAPITGGAAATPEASTPAVEENSAEPNSAEVPKNTQLDSSANTNNCSDGNVCTIDFFDTTTNSCTHAAVANCCGNNVCENNERCGVVCVGTACKSTAKITLCKQDCSLSCPASLVVHKIVDKYEDKTVQNPKTFTCETGACEQLDDGEFKLTGAASLKTYITNLGEQASDAVTSQLYCNYEYPQFNELAAIKDGDILNRMDQKLSVRDYFDGNTAKDESNTLDAQQSVGQKTTTYSFAIELVDAKYATTLSCTIWLRSGDFANKQDIKIKYVPA